MTNSWQPLLEGESLARARRAIERIRDGLPRLPVGYPVSHEIRGDSVLDVGRLGQALFWAYLAEVDDAPEGVDRAVECLDAAIEELARVITNPSLYAGFLGAGWVTEYLRPLVGESEDEDGDPNAEIDEALLESLESGGSCEAGYNLFGGIVGSGVYALERWPRPAALRILERIVERLAAGAEELPGGLGWRTGPETLSEEQRRVYPRGYFNLGLGHGVPGVVVFLSGALRAGVAPSEARRLLEGAVSWLLSTLRDLDGRPALPRFVIEGRDASASRAEASSLSWCFGDPGAAAALFSAARVLGDPKCEAAARELSASAAGRPDSGDGVADPGFCHGAAGTAHVFHRLYRATGDEGCRRASLRWFGKLLESFDSDRGETGFETFPWSHHIPAPGVTPQPREVGGLLRGVAGIGLSLLAAVCDRPPGWDRLMLLSLREFPASGGEL